MSVILNSLESNKLNSLNRKTLIYSFYRIIAGIDVKIFLLSIGLQYALLTFSLWNSFWKGVSEIINWMIFSNCLNKTSNDFSYNNNPTLVDSIAESIWSFADTL